MLLYAVVIGTISTAVAMMWQRVVSFPSFWNGSGTIFPALKVQIWYFSLLFVPVGVILYNLIWSGVLHLSLRLLGAAGFGYGATLKVVTYSYSATAFNVFPLCGAPISMVWSVVLQVIGLREMHRISTGRAIWAWLLPFLVLCSLGALAVFGLIFSLARFWPELGEQFAV